MFVFEIQMVDYIPLSNSYLKFPQFIIINAWNRQWQEYLILMQKNAKRVSKGLRKQSKELDLSGLKFPVELDRIRIFEKKKQSN